MQQIKALVGRGDLVTNVNLPNRGQIDGLPLGAVLESNAIFSRNSVQPVYAGRLPEGVHALVHRHVAGQQTLLTAAQQHDRELAFQVFLNDPLVPLSMGQARSLFEAMVHNTRGYLGEWA